ncbi:DUF6498-containing protein [Salinirubrum litoreum]|uniref:DUF6498-containing protein n=1 Tax=Salinirubrum litoreum TaxID=1126234 RepID=A0ABD5RC66_9EURY
MFRPPALPRSARALLLVVVNLAPLVGVILGEWRAETLLLLYGFEGVVTTLVVGLRMLFARRLSTDETGELPTPFGWLRTKRGALRLHPAWPPIYPRNVPYALGLLGGFLYVWAIVGLFALSGLVFDALGTLSVDVALAGVGLAVGHLVAFRSDYIGDEQYRETSASAIAAVPVRQFSVLFCSLPLLAVASESAAGRQALLALVVLGQTSAELYGFWRDHLDRDPPALLDRLFGRPEAGDAPPEFDVPSGEPDTTVGTDTRAVLLSGVVPVALTFVNRGVVTAVLVLALFGVLAFGVAFVPVLVALLLAVVGTTLSAHYLQYGTLEYRRYGDTLVCHDTLLDAPQWTCALGTVRDPAVSKRLTSRLLETSVVTFDAGLGEERTSYRLGPVTDGAQAVDALDLPRFDTTQEASDRGVAVAALCLGLVFAGVPTALLVASGGAGSAVAVLLAPLLAMLIVPLLWGALYYA